VTVPWDSHSDLSERVGVLGPGGVGGALAVHLSQAGFVVVCVTRVDAYVYDRGVLTLDWQGKTLSAEPYGTTLLAGPVDLLLVTVKAPALEDALGRIELQAVERAVILPLMNGLEHVETIRARFPGRVAAGSIGRFEAYKTAPTHIVQTTRSALISLSSSRLPPVISRSKSSRGRRSCWAAPESTPASRTPSRSCSGRRRRVSRRWPR